MSTDGGGGHTQDYMYIDRKLFPTGGGFDKLINSGSMEIDVCRDFPGIFDLSIGSRMGLKQIWWSPGWGFRLLYYSGYINYCSSLLHRSHGWYV